MKKNTRKESNNQLSSDFVRVCTVEVSVFIDMVSQKHFEDILLNSLLEAYLRMKYTASANSQLAQKETLGNNGN